jgi:isochorismate synthase
MPAPVCESGHGDVSGMTTATALRTAAFLGIWPAFGGTIEAAVADAVERLARIPPDDLASFSIALPVVLDTGFALRGGDSCWLARNRDIALCGSGVAARFDEDADARFRAACARWQRLDALDIAPLAWFTVPAATSRPSPSIGVPCVLVRTDGERTVITFSVQRRNTPPPAIGRNWLDTLRRLLDPPAPPRRIANAFVATTASPDAQTWRARVRAATAAIADGKFDKVVLARRLSIRLVSPAVPGELAQRLAGSHPGCFVLSFPVGPGRVVAASPELLASKRERRLVSHALAGTTKRYEGPTDNASAACALLASPKERHEHALVVDAIAARMAGICEQVAHAPQPSVLPLRFLQHLWTPVSGRLRAGVSLLDAVSRLHPTPAVLGFPQQAAWDWLAAIGEHRDGFYSGVAGWIDADGDGDGVVVLRSAYVEDRTAVLWAGAGIVAASDPDAEFAETELKFATMLDVLQAA